MLPQFPTVLHEVQTPGLAHKPPHSAAACLSSLVLHLTYANTQLRVGLVTLLGLTKTLEFLPPEYFLTTSPTPRKFLLPSENFVHPICPISLRLWGALPSGLPSALPSALKSWHCLLVSWHLSTWYPVDSCAGFKLLQVKNYVFYLCTSSYD